MSEEVKEQTKGQIAALMAALDAAGAVLTLPGGEKALRQSHVEELLLATIEQASIEFEGRMNTTFDQLDNELADIFNPTK